MKTLKKVLTVACFLLLIVGIVKCDTMSVQASTKKLQGGKNMKTAKTVSKNTNYIVKFKGYQTYWYKFKTSKHPTYISYEIKNMSVDSYAHMYFYSKELEGIAYEIIAKGDSETSQDYQYRLAPNTTYYISLSTSTYNKSTGNCKFSFKLNEDSDSDFVSDAKSIKMKKSYKGSIDGKDDVDCFKFKPSKSGTYKLKVQKLSGEDVYAKIITKYAIEIGHGYSYSTPYTFEVKLNKNQWYYIKINGLSSKISKYKLSIS